MLVRTRPKHHDRLQVSSGAPYSRSTIPSVLELQGAGAGRQPVTGHCMAHAPWLRMPWSVPRRRPGLVANKARPCAILPSFSQRQTLCWPASKQRRVVALSSTLVSTHPPGDCPEQVTLAIVSPLEVCLFSTMVNRTKRCDCYRCLFFLEGGYRV